MRQTTKRWSELFWAAAVMLLGANVAQAQTAQEIAKKAFGSTVLLVMEDANGQPLSLGSGFMVSVKNGVRPLISQCKTVRPSNRIVAYDVY